MKRILPSLLVCLLCSGCMVDVGPAQVDNGDQEHNSADNYFEFSKEEFTVLEEQDSHGGFHGDGSYYLILDCSYNSETALEIVDDWNSLPLSENIDLIMFGGEKDGMQYVYNLSEEAHLPRVNNGYYRFADRNAEAKESSDDSALFNRHSFNFSLAVYDSDENIFYYFEFDT